jgi:hypothetical protein
MDSMTIGILEADLSSREAVAAMLRENLRRTTALVEAGSMSRRMQEQAELKLKEAEAQVEAARLSLRKAIEPPPRLFVEQEARASNSEGIEIEARRAARVEVEAARARVTVAEARITALLDRRNELSLKVTAPILRAPETGVVDISPDFYAVTGSPIPAGAILFRVYPPHPRRVAVSAPQEAYAAFAKDQPATVIPIQVIREEIPAVVTYRSMEITPMPIELQIPGEPASGTFTATLLTEQELVAGTHCEVECVLYRGNILMAGRLLFDPRGRLKFGW